MIAEPPVHASESGHWYRRDGSPAYDVVGLNGKERPATLRDARALGLLPGVSSILKCASAPGLENWKVDQGILAALTLPRRDEEAEASWLYRVKQDSFQQGRDAAERGTAIHAQIERCYTDHRFRPDDVPAVQVRDAINAEFGSDVMWYAEQTFACTLGYGGKADLLSYPATQDVLIDFKTKDFTEETKGKLAYDEHCMQLAAYRFGLARYEARCANVFVTRSAPWLVYIHEWLPGDLTRAFEMFKGLLKFWQAKSRYDSSWEEDYGDAIPF